MKKTLFYAGVALAMVFSLNSCNKEIENPNDNNDKKGGIPFELIANPVQTRTQMDGLDTKWVADDAINVFHSVSGESPKTYVSDGEFTIADVSTNRFQGTVSEALNAEYSYDWYMIYPYNEYLMSVNNVGDNPARYYIGGRSDEAQTQNGNDNNAHLAGVNFPLYGVVTGLAANETPSISVNHVASYIEVAVTNNTEAPLTVESVSFTAPEGEKIMGYFNINFADEPISFTMYKTYASETASLTVNNGSEITPGNKGSFFLGIKPFTVTSGVLKVKVNGYEKEIPITKSTSFSAGKIKKINFNYDNTSNSATFVFNTTSGLNDLGISIPTSNGTNLDGEVVTADGVTLSFAKGKGGTDIRVWHSNGKYDLRTYTGNSMTISAPDGYYISRILLEGTKPNGFSSNPSGFSSGTWEGEAQSVTLTASANGNINTITVSYEKVDIVPTIVDKEVNNVAARGSEYTETISLQNFESAPSLSASVDGTVVVSASVSNISATSATVTYTVSNNTSGSSRTGAVTISDGSVSGALTIKQIADVFTVSSTEILLGAASGSQKTITVVSDYDWTVEDAMIDGFTVSPMQGEGSLNPVTLTITSTSANANSSVIELGLFTLKRAVDNKESETVTVSQSTNTSTTTLTVSITDYVNDNGITVSSGSDIGDRVTSLSLNNVVTMSTSGNPNCGTFWGSGTIDWRLYQNAGGNVTISVPTGHKLVSVMFTYNKSNGGVLKDANLGNVNSGTEKAVSGTSITYTVGNTGTATNGQVRITAVQVKYQ